MGAARIMVSSLPGASATQGLQRGNPPLPFSCICGLLSSFRTQENNYGDARHCLEMLPLAPSVHSWRSKQNPNNAAQKPPAPKQLL